MSTAKERLESLDKVLDEYEQGLGLPNYSQIALNEEVAQYLNMSRDALEKLTPQDAGQIAYALSSYSIFIQRSINREIARVSWADSLMKEVLADSISQQSGYGYVEKFNKAMKQDAYASDLNKIMRYAQQRADRLNFIANGIKNLSDILINLMKVRRE